jgi:hypothetical protein
MLGGDDDDVHGQRCQQARAACLIATAFKLTDDGVSCREGCPGPQVGAHVTGLELHTLHHLLAMENAGGALAWTPSSILFSCDV